MYPSFFLNSPAAATFGNEESEWDTVRVAVEGQPGLLADTENTLRVAVRQSSLSFDTFPLRIARRFVSYLYRVFCACCCRSISYFCTPCRSIQYFCTPCSSTQQQLHVVTRSRSGKCVAVEGQHIDTQRRKRLLCRGCCRRHLYVWGMVSCRVMPHRASRSVDNLSL